MQQCKKQYVQMHRQDCPTPQSEKQIRQSCSCLANFSPPGGPLPMTLKANQCEAANVNALAQTHTVTPVFILPQKFLAD